MGIRRLAAATAAMLSLACPAGAGIFYTSTSGSDSNLGTFAKPFRTITRGALKLKPGDILFVRGGVYAESFDGNIPSGSSWSKPVTISAMLGEYVTVKPTKSPESVFMFYGPQQYIVLKGLRIDGTNITSDCVKITASSSGGPASHIELYCCDVFNAYNQGILMTDGANFNLLHSTWVHDCALNGKKHSMRLDHYHGIYVATDNNTVEGCTVFHNAGYGIHCYDDSGTSVFNNTIRGNRCFGNGVAGKSGAGIILSSGVGNTAYNNVVYNNAYGISVDFSAIGARVYNNTVYANRQYGIYVGSGSTDAQVLNNISYLNGWGPDICDDGSQNTTYMCNLAGQDPLFVDAKACDFRLTVTSPARNMGLSNLGVTTDILGDARRENDCGAYAFGSVAIE